jgi:hypothetical protein
MGHDTTVITLTKQEMMRLEMILIDKDKDDALAFLRELRLKTEISTSIGMKSHLDE